MTGFTWLGRYEACGRDGLADRSRRPLTSPRRSSSQIEDKVLEVRAANPTWGGRKIRRVLQDDGVAGAPAASTITGILRRHGQLDGPRAGQARAFVRFEQPARNDLWQMDFKGH
ncbi:MAG TPA: helix-turn-helix domain-containing protein, partial [Caulobacteraceae bacterium]|nr:helix-turn-helix domain-containing protein [Caulobacteraceae bacterium]